MREFSSTSGSVRIRPIPPCVTFLTARSVRMFRAATVRTHFTTGIPSFVVTLLRAIFRRSVGEPSGIELLPAVGANESAAGIANKRPSRPGAKLLPTLLTCSRFKIITWEQLVWFKGGVVTPELGLSFGVTGRAKSDEIAQLIGLFVIVKQAIRDYVMHYQWLRTCSAMLARFVITLQGALTLSAPILSSIFQVSAEPGRIILPRPVIGASPFSKAITVAKVMLVYAYLAWLSFKRSTTGMTMDNYAFPFNRTGIKSLPCPIAGHTTEAGGVFPIRLNLKRLATLFASDCNHSLIIAHTGLLYKEALRHAVI